MLFTSHYCVCKYDSDLGSIQADDAVDVASAVVEVRHGDGVLAGGDPVLFGVGVDLEDVGSGAEDGLLSGETKPQSIRIKASNQEKNRSGCWSAWHRMMKGKEKYIYKQYLNIISLC